LVTAQIDLTTASQLVSFGHWANTLKLEADTPIPSRQSREAVSILRFRCMEVPGQSPPRTKTISLRRPLVLPYPPAIPILDPQITVRARDKDVDPIKSWLEYRPYGCNNTHTIRWSLLILPCPPKVRRILVIQMTVAAYHKDGDPPKQPDIILEDRTW
jgi:hypothetical protein